MRTKSSSSEMKMTFRICLRRSGGRTVDDIWNGISPFTIQRQCEESLARERDRKKEHLIRRCVLALMMSHKEALVASSGFRPICSRVSRMFCRERRASLGPKYTDATNIYEPTAS